VLNPSLLILLQINGKALAQSSAIERYCSKLAGAGPNEAHGSGRGCSAQNWGGVAAPMTNLNLPAPYALIWN